MKKSIGACISNSQWGFSPHEGYLTIADMYTSPGHPTIIASWAPLHCGDVTIIWEGITTSCHSLRRTFKEKHIPIDCKIDIFEKTIEPILLYGVEIWGFENTTLIEQYYMKTIKQILGLRKSTPNYMIYGEIGKYPITAKIKMRMIKYTIRLTKGEGKKWSEILFKAMINDTNTNSYRWLNCIKNILRETGFPMLTHQMYNIQRHAKTIQQTLIDQTLQELNTDSSKCTYYKYMSQYDLRSVEYPICPIRRFYCHGSWISESVESPIGDSTGRIPDLSMVVTMCDPFALGTHVWYYITSLSLATSAIWCQVMEWQFWVKMFDRYCLLDGFVLCIKWYLVTNILKLYKRRNNIKKGVIVNIFYSNYLFLYIHRDRNN